MNRIMADPIVGRGLSSLEVRKWVVEYICTVIKPHTVFDLGCGIGLYGACAHVWHKYNCKWIGLDGFLPYLMQDQVRQYYADLIYAPIEHVLDGTIHVEADLTICMDVVEHFDKKIALKILELPGRMIVSTPLFQYPQEKTEGNELERHRCWFEEQEFYATEFGYKRICKFPHVAEMGWKGDIAAFEKGE